MKKRFWIPLAALATLWAWNSSLLAPAPQNAETKLLSHRGVHQNFDRAGLDNDSCTAERIEEPTHFLIENTVQSARAAFDAGADVVEIDIHPTTDGKFALFHDWTLDCRTQGTGVTREHSMAELQQLDIGYGYTADGGKTFPLRGKYVGAMPELANFLTQFPDQKFLINFKSNDASEGEKFAAFLSEYPNMKTQIFGIYGGEAPTNYMLEKSPELLGYTPRQTKQCLIQYLSLGWTGFVPELCRNKIVAVPANYAWMMWGWPNRFQQRMHDAGATVILLGPMSPSDAGSAGIDAIDQLKMVPKNFDGYVWTNRIELIGPLINSKN